MDYASFEIDYKKLGMRIREQRKNKQFSQEKTAHLTGMSLNYYQRIESNNAKLSLIALARVSQALETSIDYLLSDSIELPDNELINLKALSEIERKFVVSTIKNLKEVELEIINNMEWFLYCHA